MLHSQQGLHCHTEPYFNHFQNNIVAPQIRNRNPMNLEKMTIGYKPSGYPMERRNRNYWNALDLSITVRIAN